MARTASIVLNTVTAVTTYHATAITSMISSITHIMVLGWPEVCRYSMVATTPSVRSIPISSAMKSMMTTVTMFTTKNIPKMRRIPPASRRSMVQIRPSWKPAERRP